jgi:hypothetical protein
MHQQVDAGTGDHGYGQGPILDKSDYSHSFFFIRVQNYIKKGKRIPKQRSIFARRNAEKGLKHDKEYRFRFWWSPGDL